MARGQSIPAGLEALLISGVLIFPEIIEINIGDLESLIIENKFLKQIRDKIIDSISLEESFNCVI